MLHTSVKLDDTPVLGEVQARRKPRSCPLDTLLYSDCPKVKALAGELADEISASLSRHLTDTARPKMVRFLTCLIVNLMQITVVDPERSLAIGLGKYAYSEKAEHTYRTVSGAMGALEVLGYVVTRIRGYRDRKRRTGATTRFGATDKLAQILTALPLSAIQIRERQPLVELRLSKRDWKALMEPYRKAVRTNEKRKAQGKPPLPVPKVPKRKLPWPRKFNVFKARRVANLRKISKALGVQFQALHVPDSVLRAALGEYKKPPNLFQTGMHRIFTTDTQQGGRFAGAWWLTLSDKEANGEIRKHIYMSAPGMLPGPVAELDYQGFHLRMLYAISEIPCESDPYLIYDSPQKNAATRKVVKRITLIMINACSRQSALRSIRKKIHKELFPRWWKRHHPGEAWPEFPKGEKADGKLALVYPGCPSLTTLVADIEKHHSQIAKHFYTGEGRRLMFLDSEIAEGVMLRMHHEQGILPLVMHDSFIVRHDYAAALKQTMQEQFVAKFGVTCPIDHKSAAKVAHVVDASSLYARMHTLWLTNTAT